MGEDFDSLDVSVRGGKGGDYKSDFKLVVPFLTKASIWSLKSSRSTASTKEPLESQ